MRVETNLKLVKRNQQIARYLFFFSFGVLLLGLFVTNSQAATQAANAADIATQDLLLAGVLPLVVVILAFITTIISVRMTNLWIKEPRPENVLRDGLKGLSNKSVLYNYYHMPAKHVLVAPQGVFVFHVPYQDGRFTVEGDRWKAHKSALGHLLSAFRYDSIGNPSDDAQRAAAHVQALIEPIAPGVQVQPAVVFVAPRVELTVTNPTIPVLHISDKSELSLRNYMRDVVKQGKKTLTPEQISAFEEATLSK